MAPYQYSDYQIGIFCALSKERIAVIAMLDHEHEQIPNRADDNNNYTFGKIGDHNVVVTSPGPGNHGINAAVRTAATFKKLKFRFVVGIAAALPGDGKTRDRDVRLGDIVIGVSKKQDKPYVVQYSSGRATKDGFQIEPPTFAPPEEILSTLDGLEEKHQRKGPTYLKHLKKMLQNDLYTYEHDEHNYSFPQDEDRLFHRGFSHIASGDGTCNACMTKPFAIIERSDRPKLAARITDDMDGLWIKHLTARDVDYPTVHRGTVACADILVRDPIERDAIYDRIYDKYGVVSKCVEMESSGVLTSWSSCLIIRGICDYADSHKNDKWQCFAAATAASFLKDLVLELPTDQVQQADPIDLNAEIDRMNRTSIAQRVVGSSHATISDGTSSLEHKLSQLCTNRSLLHDNAFRYHLFMTAAGLQLYSEIWDLLSQGRVSVTLDQFEEGLAPLQLPRAKLGELWRRLAAPKDQLVDTSIMALLYMIHLEVLSEANRHKPEAQYDPDDERNGRFALMKYWTNCPDHCGLLWNYIASDNGYYKVEPDRDLKSASRCYLYRLYEAKRAAFVKNETKYQPNMSTSSLQRAKNMLVQCRTAWLEGR